MKRILLVFPNQLFENHPLLGECDQVLLIEEFLFFREFDFHQLKLVFHRASMKRYYKRLAGMGKVIRYIESGEPGSDIRDDFYGEFKDCEILVIDPVDNWLLKRLKHMANKFGALLTVYDTPLFINSQTDNRNYQIGKKRYFQTDYYQYFRKKYQILIDDSGAYLGGRLSFDDENRKKLPKGVVVPKLGLFEADEIVIAAKNYIMNKFSQNPGSPNMIDEMGFYATDFETCDIWFEDFLKNRFLHFGAYEDAISWEENHEILYHSGLALYMNVGLLLPNYVVHRAISFGLENEIPMASIEGFVRQILGWREFVRHVYEAKGVFQRTFNFWGFKRKIPSSFYRGETGIEPVDLAIKKVLKMGYNHHIERLMILGNFMLLCEFDPDEVYRWFMEMYIDSYDWVMVPNVYGMIAFADGGLMTTKPYISGSNYLLKMSSMKKGAAWQQVWDALFWRFMDKHRQVFAGNMRMNMLLKNWDNRDEKVRKSMIMMAEDFLEKLN